MEKTDYLSEEPKFYYSSQVAKRYFYILKYNQTRFKLWLFFSHPFIKRTVIPILYRFKRQHFDERVFF
jgi:hypothetical protein